MQISFGSWQGWAAECDLNKLVDYIYTGRNADTADHDPVVLERVAALPSGSRVLDFGCGVGRNVIRYARKLPEIQFVGYDSKPMLSRADEWCRHAIGIPSSDIPNLSLQSDWDALATERFDCIYATIVLQHIDPSQLTAYLAQFRRMAPLLLVFGRRRSDFGSVSVWGIMENAGLHPINAHEIGYSAEGEGEEHIPLCIYHT